MQRTIVGLTSIIYILVLVIISVELVVVFNPIHQGLIEDHELKTIDKSITRFFISQDFSLLKDVGLTTEEMDVIGLVSRALNKGLFLLAGLIALMGFLLFNMKDSEKFVVLSSPFMAVIILAVPSLLLVINFSYVNDLLHSLFLKNIFLNGSVLNMIYNKSFVLDLTIISLEIFLLIATIKLFSYRFIMKKIIDYKNFYFKFLDDHINRDEEHDDKLIIRRARVDDAKILRDLIKENIIDLDSKKQLGLLEYEPPTITQIKIGIKENQPIYVLIKNNRLIGGVLCFDKVFLSDYFPDERIEQFLCKRFDNFHHIDTLVIKQHYRNKGLGTRLMNRLLSDLSHHPKNHLLFGAILHKPRSLDLQVYFLRKFSFQHKGDLFIDEDTAFGIYMKELEFNKLDVFKDWLKSLRFF